MALTHSIAALSFSPPPPYSSPLTNHLKSLSLLGQPLTASPYVAVRKLIPVSLCPCTFSVCCYAWKATGNKCIFIVSRRLSGLEEAMRIRRSRELRDLVKTKKRQPLWRGSVTEPLQVPDHIPRPPYAGSNVLPDLSKDHQFHDDKGIARMRAAGELAARVLEFAGT